MKRQTKQVMLNLDYDLYFKIKSEAECKHLPVATYVKLMLVQLVEKGV